ncbi:putative lipid II flippase FtsW [Patescibacteria group bacterium]|nr:putative lipid II flippase FtsW [Patescibacteria group bacterium]
MINESRTAKSDRVFLTYVFVLLVFGLIALTSASAPVGYERFSDNYYFIKRQLLYGLLPGLLFFFILARMHYGHLKKLSWPIYIFSLILLSLIFIPGIGTVLNGSRSWIFIGGFHFQPAELAKLSIIIIMAALLSQPNRDLDNWRTGLLPVLAIVAPAVLLILGQPDIGTLSILVVIIFAMLYLGRTPKIYLMILGLLAIVAFAGLVLVAPYRVQRLTTFLHPELDPKGVGYQINQAFLAVGSGGLWGLGLGHSRQKFQYLPEVNADSIFAIIAEEMGFLVSSIIVVLILAIGWRGLKIAKRAPDEFGYLLVSGIMVWFVWQSFLNIGAMVGALPLTGVPLPFVSHGGSALMTALSAVGVVASVSRE